MNRRRCSINKLRVEHYCSNCVTVYPLEFYSCMYILTHCMLSCYHIYIYWKTNTFAHSVISSYRSIEIVNYQYQTPWHLILAWIETGIFKAIDVFFDHLLSIQHFKPKIDGKTIEIYETSIDQFDMDIATRLIIFGIP